jgi:hypothetical protein
MNTQIYPCGNLLREIYINPIKKYTSRPIYELINDVLCLDITLKGISESGKTEFEEELFAHNFELACKEIQLTNISEEDFIKLREVFQSQDWIFSTYDKYYDYDVAGYEIYNEVEYNCEEDVMRQFDEIFDSWFMQEFFN